MSEKTKVAYADLDQDQRTMSPHFRQEWYGTQAKIIEQTEDYIVVDYGSQGRGIITNYFLFDGIQLCFLDFDTAETMPSQKFNPDIIQITIARKGDMNVSLPIIQSPIYRRDILALQAHNTCQCLFPFR